MSQKITPFLWFDKEAEEAMNLYVDVFNGAPNKTGESKVVSIRRYEKGMNAPGADELQGKVLTGVFELNGQQFMCLDGGPLFKFNESISMYVECENQAEINYFADKLSADPKAEICGWLKDKFGLSWQIIPKNMSELLKSKEAVNAILKMKRINIAELENAGKS